MHRDESTSRRRSTRVVGRAQNLSWRSVIAFGNFEEIRAPSDRRSILGKLLARFPLLTPVESVMAHDAGAPDSVVFRIRVDRITGVAEG